MGYANLSHPMPGSSTAAGAYPVWHGWRLLLQDLTLNPAHVLRRAQLPNDLFARVNASLDTPQFFRLWTALEAESDDQHGATPLPLRIAQAFSTDWFEPALFAALCSTDLNAALARVARYKRLMAPMTLQVDNTPQSTALALSWLDKTLPPPPVLVAFELVFFVQLARLATRSQVQPIGLISPTPLGDTSQYEAFFGCPLAQGPVPRLIFSAQDARRPFLTANHGMWSFFEPALRQRLHELDRQATMTERVRSALLEALPAGELAMDAIGRRLGVSTRTLQRRLRDEGSGFQKTLDEVRRSLSQHYLEHSAMSGTEISFLLGFEEPSSFVRAFQGWTGTSPQTARAAKSRLAT